MSDPIKHEDLDMDRVSREAHELSNRRGRDAHLSAIRLSRLTYARGDMFHSRFWAAVHDQLKPRQSGALDEFQETSSPVVEQRIRNRLIDWLEMLVNYDPDPPPFDLNEVLNQLKDWHPPGFAHPASVYTTAEVESLSEVGMRWEVLCSVTPKMIVDESAVLERSEWTELVSASKSALAVLRHRGRLSEA
jgi:hypothetical protein